MLRVCEIEVSEKRGEFGIGSVWTRTAIDADTKLIASWMVGNRDVMAAHEFMKDLAGRLSNRVQLTTDGLAAYLSAVEKNFGRHVGEDLRLTGGIRKALQSSGVPGLRTQGNHRQAGSEAHQHILRGAPEPNHADAYAPLHSPN
jgi:hypothetical protein